MTNFIPKATGSQADVAAKVDVSTVHSGYFSKKENSDLFTEKGIRPILNNLPNSLKYVDFGGAHGHLASEVKYFLNQSGRSVNAMVIDGNERILSKARELGLSTLLGNLDEVQVCGLDLATMRAVLHYNSHEMQKQIMINIFNSLRTGGLLIHQYSSGNEENCRLRSAINNLPSLERGGNGDYRWITTAECSQLTASVGFKNCFITSSNPNSWTVSEQWERFHKSSNLNADDLGKKRKIFFADASTLIEDFISSYGAVHLGVEKLPGDYRIHYEYPIIVSRKP